MISPYLATIILCSFIVVFGLVLPLLERIPFMRKSISYRWALVVAMMAMMIGCILNFSHLSDQARVSTIIGVMIICGIYIIIRSFEKILSNGWTLGIKKVHLEKGDIKAEVETKDDKGGTDDNSAAQNS